MFYRCDAWSITNEVQHLEAVEMWFLRRMLRIPWTTKKSVEKVVRDEASNNEVRKIQPKITGHIPQRGKLEYIMTAGKDSRQ